MLWGTVLIHVCSQGPSVYVYRFVATCNPVLCMSLGILCVEYPYFVCQLNYLFIYHCPCMAFGSKC